MTPPAPRWRRAAVVLAAATLAAVAGCAGGDPDPGATNGSNGTNGSNATGPAGTGAPVLYPTDTWPVGDPAELGLDPGILGELPTSMAGTDTDCVMVVKDGRVALEHTAEGMDADRDQIVWSVSKSITGLLVGLAVHDGDLRVDQPAADLIHEWRGTPADAVTIANLLAMDSGRTADQHTEFVTLPTGVPDQTAFAIGLPQLHPPGTRWGYSNAAVQVLEAVLERATGRPVTDYAAERLFGPIGVEVDWLRDQVGNPWTYGGAIASCRDLARLGYLMLHRGRWEDRQVVPEEWVRVSTQPSQELRPNYGYLWWLNRPVPEAPPGAAPNGEGGAEAIPGVAEDVFLARGLLGQFVVVVPEDRTVVVRTGGQDEGRDRFPTTDALLAHLMDVVTRAEQGRPG